MKFAISLKLAAACLLGTVATARAEDATTPKETSVVLVGKTASTSVVVKSMGKFGSPEWKSSITIAKKGREKAPIYRDQSAHLLQGIQFLPRQSGVKDLQKRDVTVVCYLLVVDGLDPDELVMIVIHDGKVYKSTAEVTRPLEEASKIESLKINPSMPPALRKFAEREWSELIRTWNGSEP